MKIEPINSYVVVKPVIVEQKSAIYLEGRADPNRGEVVASDSDLVKPGDIVITPSFGAEVIREDGQEYKLVEARSIKAIIR